MSSPHSDEYELIDCGDGRRLERFGRAVISRPAPAARFRRTLAQSDWDRADLVFERGKGWTGTAPTDWPVRFDGATLLLEPAGGGQVGVFPEHYTVCATVRQRLGGANGWTVLNLFAHTGLATLLLAATPGAGEITHLDASPAAVRRAKHNAAASGLADRSIRWLVDDALRFMDREIRRQRRYHLILADPPAYGRDRRGGGEWKLDRDLPELLTKARQLLLPDDAALLCLTCHATGWDAASVRRRITEVWPAARVEAQAILLPPRSGGRPLPAGIMALARAVPD